jgi:predicted esterase
LSPNGRGPSNGFCPDHAQVDIAEAVVAVQASYPIDPDRIILTGFSMGGYGVYRTFWGSPEKFRAMAILSGRPRFGSVEGDTCPDFSREKQLSTFRGIPMFVFHGKRDRNCPIAATEMLVEKLRSAGADVDFHIDDSRGHEVPGFWTIWKYKRWLNKILKI